MTSTVVAASGQANEFVICRRSLSVVPDDEYQLVMLDDGLLLSAFQTVQCSRTWLRMFYQKTQPIVSRRRDGCRSSKRVSVS
jgi:CRISPR/Cas system CSM-associated protein Csm2 small subunit